MKWLYWFVGIVAIAVIGYNLAHPTYTFRYRATLTVDSPQGPRSSSSVIELTWKKKNALGRAFSGGMPWTTEIHGIAPIIDLGPYGTIIAALRRRHGGQTGKPIPGKEGVGSALGWPFAAYDNVRGAEPWGILSVRGPAQMKHNRWPQLVWIPPGTTDPDKAIPLLPREFSQYIGPVHFNSMMIEPTDDPVVERIEPAPAWLIALHDRIRGIRRSGWKPGVRGRFYLQINQIETGGLRDGP